MKIWKLVKDGKVQWLAEKPSEEEGKAECHNLPVRKKVDLVNWLNQMLKVDE